MPSVRKSEFSKPANALRSVLCNDAAGGFALLVAAVIGLLWANSPFRSFYAQLLAYQPVGVLGAAHAPLSVADWINSGLMAIFFLAVGLEIKREVVEGELSTFSRAALPAIAAFGGIIVPAGISVAFLWGHPERLSGWAVPIATDIAFALAALSIVGRGVPSSLKLYLTALAVIDDIAAIAIIALVFTVHLSLDGVIGAFVCLGMLLVMNRMRVAWLPAYLCVGVALWAFVLRSGIHATLAGVLLATAIPTSAVRRFETALRPWISFVVLPVFGLASAGVSLEGVRPGILLGVLPLAVATALFVGKQVGIFGFSQLAIRSGFVEAPQGATWPMMYGIALLGGIGFTMGLFIGSLAFTSPQLLLEAKLGIFAGSLVSAAAGYMLLRRAITLPHAAVSDAG